MNCKYCIESADVIEGKHGLCCEHYAKRVALARRNADHLCYDPVANTYEPPMEEQKSVRNAADRSLLAGKADSFLQERAKMRLERPESAPRGSPYTQAWVGSAGAEKAAGEG